MERLVARLDDDLVAAIDKLVAEGVVASRSDAVSIALRQFVDRHQRATVGREIVAGYRRTPQTESDAGWLDEATHRMITEEPW